MVRGAIIVFIVLAVLLLLGRISDLLKIPRSKISFAKVSGKSEVGRSEDGTGMGMNKPLWGIYHVNFEFEDRKGVTLPVPKKTYEAVSAGSKGVLVYVYIPVPVYTHKGFPIYTYKRFREFHLDKTLAEIINPDGKI